MNKTEKRLIRSHFRDEKIDRHTKRALSQSRTLREARPAFPHRSLFRVHSGLQLMGRGGREQETELALALGHATAVIVEK